MNSSNKFIFSLQNICILHIHKTKPTERKKMQRCQAITRKGTQCKRKQIGPFCCQHIPRKVCVNLTRVKVKNNEVTEVTQERACR